MVAFATHDQSILENTPSNIIAVDGQCPSWFAAYMQHSKYTVLTACEESKPSISDMHCHPRVCSQTTYVDYIPDSYRVAT